MKPAPFQYHAPNTVEDAVALLVQTAGDDGRILAGGQSLVPTMAFRLARPTHLIDINGIDALKRLAVEDGKLCIGAGVRHAAFHPPVVDGPLGRLLSEVVKHIAHVPIRYRGTFCGSVAHADPASEWCTLVTALDGEMVAQSASGTRVIPAREYFQGIMTTALADNELLREVRLPVLSNATRFGFQEFSRRAGDFAAAMALVTFTVDDGVIRDPHVAIGGAEAHPRRIAEAETALAGHAPDAATFAAAADAAAESVEPLDDVINPATFRRHLVRTLTGRALERAV